MIRSQGFDPERARLASNVPPSPSGESAQPPGLGRSDTARTLCSAGASGALSSWPPWRQWGWRTRRGGRSCAGSPPPRTMASASESLPSRSRLANVAWLAWLALRRESQACRRVYRAWYGHGARRLPAPARRVCGTGANARLGGCLAGSAPWMGSQGHQGRQDILCRSQHQENQLEAACHGYAYQLTLAPF